MKEARKQLLLENVKIGFKNFSGKPDDYTREGDRNFTVFFSDYAYAQELAEEGWNIKFPDQSPNQDAEDFMREPFLNVAVRYDNFPPNIFLIEEETKTKNLMTDETIAQLDTIDIISCDIEITPYHWERNGKAGIKAYAKTMYVVMEPAPFFAKYQW